MNINNLMSMMNGNGMNADMMTSMLSKMMGNRINPNNLKKQLDSAYSKMEDGFITGLISMLYKEYPTESISSLFKETDDTQEKVKILSGLVTKAAPSVLEKMNENDINRLYQILQRKRG